MAKPYFFLLCLTYLNCERMPFLYIIDHHVAPICVSYERFSNSLYILYAAAPVTNFPQILLEACAYKCKQSEILVLRVVTKFAPALYSIPILVYNMINEY